jgi:glutaminyl-peptide cyclotransferase
VTSVLLLVLAVAVAAASGFSSRQARRAPAPAAVAQYRVVHVYPHDPEAFTQGLVYLDGFLYEGTGLNGRSSIRKVRLENGEVVQIQKLDAQYFGEGIAILGNSLFELTWQAELGFVYDRSTFQRTGTFTYKGEGWGLTQDGKRLIMSDGSSYLRFIDPVTRQEVSRLQVRDGGKPVDRLNELEYVKGEVLANVWQTERIARISPKTGQVLGWVDLSGLLSAREAQTVDVLNGIAYDAEHDRLFVTGKLWPKLFEIKVVEPPHPPARK